VLDSVLLAYDEAWNAPDSQTRDRLLEQALTPTAELVDPGGGRFTGINAIAQRIEGFGKRFPTARVTITSGVDEHHGFARYLWAITDRDGRTILDGMDIVERSDTGLISRVIMFFGQLPPGDE
jgi:SnoaL-like domain